MINLDFWLDDTTGVLAICIFLARLADFLIMPEGRRWLIRKAGNVWVLLEEMTFRGIITQDAAILLEFADKVKNHFKMPIFLLSVLSSGVIAVYFYFISYSHSIYAGLLIILVVSFIIADKLIPSELWKMKHNNKLVSSANYSGWGFGGVIFVDTIKDVILAIYLWTTDAEFLEIPKHYYLYIMTLILFITNKVSYGVARYYFKKIIGTSSILAMIRHLVFANALTLILFTVVYYCYYAMLNNVTLPSGLFAGEGAKTAFIVCYLAVSAFPLVVFQWFLTISLFCKIVSYLPWLSSIPFRAYYSDDGNNLTKVAVLISGLVKTIQYLVKEA